MKNSVEIIGNSKALKDVLVVVDTVAKSKCPVFIGGKTGTGKELLAKRLHEFSGRSGKFVIVNCATLPENLLESELFGHEKGAFTNAISQKIGKFELANKGTLFLDEIGDLPLNVQVKLLRFLQDKKFERVGGTYMLEVDVRIVCATHRDLEVMVKNGLFREDLYFRIKGVSIQSPSLSERKEDIVPLLLYFFQKHRTAEQVVPDKIGAKLESLLQSYSWPGHVRELENMAFQMVSLNQFGFEGFFSFLGEEKTKKLLSCLSITPKFSYSKTRWSWKRKSRINPEKFREELKIKIFEVEQEKEKLKQERETFNAQKNEFEKMKNELFSLAQMILEKKPITLIEEDIVVEVVESQIVKVEKEEINESVAEVVVSEREESEKQTCEDVVFSDDLLAHFIDNCNQGKKLPEVLEDAKLSVCKVALIKNKKNLAKTQKELSCGMSLLKRARDFEYDMYNTDLLDLSRKFGVRGVFSVLFDQIIKRILNIYSDQKKKTLSRKFGVPYVVFLNVKNKHNKEICKVE